MKILEQVDVLCKLSSKDTNMTSLASAYDAYDFLYFLVFLTLTFCRYLPAAESYSERFQTSKVQVLKKKQLTAFSG